MRYATLVFYERNRHKLAAVGLSSSLTTFSHLYLSFPSSDSRIPLFHQ